MFKRLLPDKLVNRLYVNSGIDVATSSNYLGLYFILEEGEAVRAFERSIRKWEKWEKEYARRGYKTVSFDEFVSSMTDGKSLDNLLGKKHEENEEPIFHSVNFRKSYESSSFRWAFNQVPQM